MKKYIKQKLYTIKIMLLSIKNVPILIDSYWSHFLFRIHRAFNKVNSTKVHPNYEFYKKQFVAHGRYVIEGIPHNSLCLFKKLFESGYKIVECDIMFTKDEIPILCHDDSLKCFAKDKYGFPVDEKISQLSLNDVLNFNFAIDGVSVVRVTLFEDLLALANEYDACIEIDLNKLYLGRKRCRILYNLVKSANMLDNVIWEIYPHDFYSLALIDQSLIYQFDNSWTALDIIKSVRKKKYSSLIILSQWFHDGIIRCDSNLTRQAHEQGFLVKCATINKKENADAGFASGVDLMTTDALTNKDIR